MLSKAQIEGYHEQGYLKVERLFSLVEAEELASEMVRVIEQWGQETIGWVGPWRDRYLDDADRLNTKAVFMHNPHHYSPVWGRVIFHEKMIACLGQLIDGPVQYHHTVLHAKPPELGTPFRCTKITHSIHTTVQISSTVYCISTIRHWRAAR